MIATTLPRTTRGAQAPKTAQGPVMPPTPKRERTARFNHGKTSYAGVVTNITAPRRNSREARREGILTRRVSGREVKTFREAHSLSARELASRLGYSRPYVKRVEGNSLTASPTFAARFYALRETMDQTPAPQPHPLTIISPGEIGEDITTLVLHTRPRRCSRRACRAAFIPRDRRQKFCSDTCRTAHAKRKHKRT